MLTKVKLRQKPLADGKLSLYLDFYPPIADPVTGKKTRREFLQLHIWEKPKGSLQRQHNADPLFVAEQIRFERENALLKSNIYSDLEKEHIAYLERSEKKFIEYYEESFKDKPLANWYRYSGAFYLLKKFCPKDIKFKDITLKWCENFRNFVLRADSLFHEGKTLAQTTRHNYFRCFRTILLQAFNEGYLRENLNAKLECIPRKDRPRQLLSVSELNQLIQTPCSKDNLKRAALFSALTGLRFGDIQALTWEKLEHQPGEGYYLNFTMRKTGGIMRLPISEQAVELMGRRGKYGEYVFPKLSRDPLYRKALREWVYDAGTQKHISFHCFRHSFATNQLTAGTDITTVSKMLGHSDLKTTMIYAKVVDNVKREAADSVFAIGQSAKDKRLRYVKQVKVRAGAFKYDSSNIIVYEIEKMGDFLGFEFKEFATEADHLKQRTENELTQQELNVLNLHKQGFSYRNIAERIGISKSTVSNIVKKHLSKAVQPSNDDGHMDTDGQLDIDWVEDENTDEEL